MPYGEATRGNWIGVNSAWVKWETNQLSTTMLFLRLASLIAAVCAYPSQENVPGSTSKAFVSFAPGASAPTSPDSVQESDRLIHVESIAALASEVQSPTPVIGVFWTE